MVKYEDCSLIDKLSFLFNTSGFLLLLFAFQNFLTTKLILSDGELAVFILSFFCYVAATMTIICYCTMGEVEDGKMIRIIHLGCSFFAGLFLLIGLGIYGDRLGDAASPNSMLLGVFSMLFIFASFGLAIFAFLVSYGPEMKKSSPEEGSTQASEPTTFTG